MMNQVYTILQQIITACSGWFTQILDATGAGDFYLAMVFISLSIGFLLSNFSNGMGIHTGSDEAARAYRKSGNGKFSSRNRAKRYGSGKNGGMFERK